MNRIKAFQEKIVSRIVIADGGLGTLLQDMGLPAGLPPEFWNLEQPDRVRKAHRLYYAAGARIITTNSFGANIFKMKHFDPQADITKINMAAAQLANHEIGADAYVAGSVGPTGELLQPMGNATFELLEEAFREQISGLKAGGVDFIIIETMSDLGELLAAARTCKRLSIPFIASMTFNEDLKTLSGSSPK